MSTETHVFFTGKLPSKQAFQKKLKELGFPISLRPFSGSLESVDGFLPMSFRRGEAGVGFDIFDGPEAVAEFSDVGVDSRFDRVASFRWSGDLLEAACGTCGAAALAALLDGMVYDEAEGRLMCPEEAAEVARKVVADLPPPQPAGTTARQRDLRRYLKPLLDARPDLVLIERYLIIRPFKHLLRGAWFESSQWSAGFYLNWFVCSLSYGSMLRDRIDRFEVGNANFVPALYDCLQHDLFSKVGKIVTLEDYLAIQDSFVDSGRERIAPVVYGPGHAKTEAALARRMQALRPIWLGKYRAAEAEGIDAVVRFYREQEAECAEAWKLEAAWQPAPFPIEIPDTGNKDEAAEHVFVADPWPKFPDGWREELPTVPGEIRFADWLWQSKRGEYLVGPLTSAEAEQRFAEAQTYVLATCLPDGSLLTLKREGDRDSTPASALPYSRLTFKLWPPSGYLLNAFFRRLDAETSVLSRVSFLTSSPAESVCSIFLDLEKGQFLLQDFRHQPVRSTKASIKPEDMQVRVSDETSDQFRPYLTCILSLLNNHHVRSADLFPLSPSD